MNVALRSTTKHEFSHGGSGYTATATISRGQKFDNWLDRPIRISEGDTA